MKQQLGYSGGDSAEFSYLRLTLVDCAAPFSRIREVLA